MRISGATKAEGAAVLMRFPMMHTQASTAAAAAITVFRHGHYEQAFRRNKHFIFP
jgi:hypothetical protein